MSTDNRTPPLQPMNPDQEWRRTFIVAVNQLAAGEVDHLQIDEWAIPARARHGHRNPVEVAHEEWACGNLPRLAKGESN